MLRSIKKVPKWAWIAGGTILVVSLWFYLEHKRNADSADLPAGDPCDPYGGAYDPTKCTDKTIGSAGGVGGVGGGGPGGVVYYQPYPSAKDEAPTTETPTETPAEESTSSPDVPFTESPAPSMESTDRVSTTPKGGFERGEDIVNTGHTGGRVEPVAGSTPQAGLYTNRPVAQPPKVGVSGNKPVAGPTTDPNKLAKITNEINRLNGEIGNLQGDINRLQGEIDGLQNHINQLTNAIQSHPKANQRGQWENERNQDRSNIDNKRTRISQDQANIQHKRDEITWWQAQR